jgi:hypothetical protein
MLMHIRCTYVVTDGRGTGTESRELAAGVDRNSGAGTGVDGVAARWKGRARWKTRLFVIPMGVRLGRGLAR